MQPYPESRDIDVTRVTPDPDGRVDPAAIADAIRPDTVHIAGGIPIDVDTVGLGLASLSVHEFYGPKGMDALYVRDGVELEPSIHGGGPELAMDDIVERREPPPGLHGELVATLGNETTGTPIGHSDRRRPGYATMGFPGSSGADLVQAFADRDIPVSSGSAYHSGDRSPARVLAEMGIDTDLAFGAVRFSLGRDTTSDTLVRNSFPDHGSETRLIGPGTPVLPKVDRNRCARPYEDIQYVGDRLGHVLGEATT